MDRPVRELNLELGRPDAAEALRRLAAEVEAARKMGTPAMKLIHGYGSSGKGGRLRTACRTWLRQQELCFLPGEEFSIFNQEARRWLALCPRLRQDRDLDAENRGVTYVLLKKWQKNAVKRFFFKRFTAFFHSRDALYPSPQAHMESRMGFRLRLSRVREYSTRGGTSA